MENNPKKKIREIIVVEGKNDISAVKAAVDAEIIQVNGFSVKKKGALEKLKKAYEQKGLIILTDPDFAGNLIRNHINETFPKSKNAYISIKDGLKDGDIGIENASPEVIMEALERAKCCIEEKRDKEEFSLNLLIELNLIGGSNSSDLRLKISEKLGIGYSNGKQFLSKLNRYGITKEEFLDAYESLKNN